MGTRGSNSVAEIFAAYQDGERAAREGKPQTFNPHNPKSPGQDYNAGLALAWSNGFCSIAFPGAVEG